MADINSFNPYIVFIQQGKFPQKQIFMERMCLWYELELLYDAEPDAGVITLDQFIPVKEGVLFLRRPGDVVRGITPYAYTCIVFDPCYDPAFAGYYALDPLLHLVDIPFLQKLTQGNRRSFDFLDSIPRVMHLNFDFDVLKPLFQIADLATADAPEQRLLAKAKLTELLLELSAHSGGAGRIYSVHPQLITESQQFMSRYYREPLTLEHIAGHVSLSKEYFCRLFSRHTGMTPIAYLQQVRIYHAKLQLMASTDSIESIALSCGFRSASYFYTVFKAHTGMTPEKFRSHQASLPIATLCGACMLHG